MATVEQGIKTYQMYVAGQWVGAQSGETYEIVDPATEQPFATVPKGGVADAERAVQAARKAFDEGPWPRKLAVERSELLHAVADKIRERADELAAVETRQMGKLLADSLIDVNDAALRFIETGLSENWMDGPRRASWTRQHRGPATVRRQVG